MASGDSERGRRVRVGLTGLAAVLVIVAAVAAVFESASDDPATIAAANNSAENAASADEPLAQIGVVPSSETANGSLDLIPETPPEPIDPVPPPAARN